jgi:hypothetical protein
VSIRDIHFGVRLPFETLEDQEDSEDIIMRLLGVMCRLNLMYLRNNPSTKPLYEADVKYAPPDQVDGRKPLSASVLRKLLAVLRDDVETDPETALMVVRLLKGMEIFLDIPALYRRGKGDCNELAPVRVAELWRSGIAASPYLTKEPNDRGGVTYHALVLWPDGSSEDPSLILGMGGPSHGGLRREEIRKNAERWGKYMGLAQRLIDAEGVHPDVAGRYVDEIGLAPRDRIFRSPYREAA